jgi:hypothetical protein
MQISEKRRRHNSFGPLWREITRRAKAPLGQFSYWVFFILGVVFFSACGIWFELGKYYFFSPKSPESLDGIQTAIFTFFPAVASTASMQLNFSDNDMKYLKTFGYAIGMLVPLLSIALLFIKEHFSPTTSISIGVVASLFAIFTWWIANADDPNFDDNVDPDILTGGNTGTPLKGNISGFKTS